MNAHTPTPWYTSRLAGNHQGGVASEVNGCNVAVTYQGDADAELIVRAVNSHEALVAALKMLCPLTHYDSCRGLRWGPMAKEEREKDCTCGAAAARAALALAQEVAP